MHLLERQAGRPWPRVFCATVGTCVPTQISQASGSHMHDRVDRLHRRMGQERQFVGGLDALCRRLACAASTSPVVPAHDRLSCPTRLACSASSISALERLALRSVVPADVERLQPLLRRPEMIADDGDGVVDPDHVAHARNGARRRVVDAVQRAADASGRRRRSRSSCRARARRCRTSPLPFDLARRVDAPRRLADQLEILRVLQRHVLAARASCPAASASAP